MPDAGVTDIEAWRARAHAFAEEVVRPRAAEAIDRDDASPRIDRRRVAGDPDSSGSGCPPPGEGPAATRGRSRGLGGTLGGERRRRRPPLRPPLGLHPPRSCSTERTQQRERLVRPLAAGRRLGAFALDGAGGRLGRRAVSPRATAGPTPGSSSTAPRCSSRTGRSADVVLSFATRDPRWGRTGSRRSWCRRERPASAPPRSSKARPPGERDERARLPGRAGSVANLLGPEGDGTEGRARRPDRGPGRHCLVRARGRARGVRGAAAAAVAEPVRRESRRAVAASVHDLVGGARRSWRRRRPRTRTRGGRSTRRPRSRSCSRARAAVRIASRRSTSPARRACARGAAPERLLRDARVFPIVEGTTEIQELILGRTLRRRVDRSIRRSSAFVLAGVASLAVTAEAVGGAGPDRLAPDRLRRFGRSWRPTGSPRSIPRRPKRWAPSLAGESLVLACPDGEREVARRVPRPPARGPGRPDRPVPRPAPGPRPGEVRRARRRSRPLGVHGRPLDRRLRHLERRPSTRLDILVATSEKADGLLRKRVPWLERLGDRGRRRGPPHAGPRPGTDARGVA